MTHTKKQVTMTVTTLRKLFDYTKKYDAEMQAQMMRAFLWAAENPEGIGMSDLQVNADMSAASLSRIIQALSKVGFKTRAGLGWLIATEDPMERRRKIVKLTPKGFKVLEDLTSILN